jgi:hypothetical protein
MILFYNDSYYKLFGYFGKKKDGFLKW